MVLYLVSSKYAVKYFNYIMVIHSLLSIADARIWLFSVYRLLTIIFGHRSLNLEL